MQILKGLQPYAVLKYYNSENKKIYNADCLRGVLSTYLGYLQITELTNLIIAIAHPAFPVFHIN